MENLNIAVVSPDPAFNRVFCVSLVDACRQIRANAYTTEEFIRKWAEPKGGSAYHEKYDFVLWAGDEIREAYGDNVIYLTDRSSLVQIDHEHRRYALYKYSRTAVTVAAIFDIYAHLTGFAAPLVKQNDVTLLAFASYCGGSGCTTVCRAVSQELTRFRGRRVLYLSLEEVDSAADYLTPQNGVPQNGVAQEGIRTEAEYLYRLLSKGTAPFLEPYLIQDPYGVCSFMPPAGKNPLRELTAEEMMRLIAVLSGSGLFDVIAADVSTSLGEGAAAVCGAADRICLIAREEEAGMRERHYQRQLEDSCGKAIRERILRTIMPADESAVSRRERLVPLAPLEGNFGQEISKLTDTLLHMVE